MANGFTFYDCLRLMAEAGSGKIRRKNWDSTYWWQVSMGGRLMDSSYDSPEIDFDDILAKDWQYVPDMKTNQE